MKIMDLIRIKNGVREIVKKDVSNDYVFSLMKRARDRYGILSDSNKTGFMWKNAHKLEFTANGFEFKTEWMADLEIVI